MAVTNKLKPVVITPGEPAGVGPDLTVALAQRLAGKTGGLC